MKKPMLVVGVVMITLVYYQSQKKGGWGPLKNERLNPTPCSAVIVKLNRVVPENWEVLCQKNDLLITIKELQVGPNAPDFRPSLYRQMANNMIQLSRLAVPHFLARVTFVQMTLVHDKLTLQASSEGRYIVKLRNLSTPDFIMNHLKSTVKVQEIVK